MPNRLLSRLPLFASLTASAVLASDFLQHRTPTRQPPGQKLGGFPFVTQKDGGSPMNWTYTIAAVSAPRLLMRVVMVFDQQSLTLSGVAWRLSHADGSVEMCIGVCWRRGTCAAAGEAAAPAGCAGCRDEGTAGGAGRSRLIAGSHHGAEGSLGTPIRAPGDHLRIAVGSASKRPV